MECTNGMEIPQGSPSCTHTTKPYSCTYVTPRCVVNYASATGDAALGTYHFDKSSEVRFAAYQIPLAHFVFADIPFVVVL